MKKKLEQAVEYANKTNPSSKSNNQPSTSKRKRPNSNIIPKEVSHFET